MVQFPSAAQLASWAGVCPGHNESAGKVKSSHTRPGNHYLKRALGIAAARTNGTYLQARYKRLAGRRGPMRALVATEHSMLIAIWRMLSQRQPYDKLGSDYFSRINPRLTRRRVAQLSSLGFEVILTPHLHPTPWQHRPPVPRSPRRRIEAGLCRIATRARTTPPSVFYANINVVNPPNAPQARLFTRGQ
ncbi:IS110 family transposase [Rhodococcus sp. WS4]|nr:IS110 family transposase [Rhodococcus sp. WS4]